MLLYELDEPDSKVIIDETEDVLDYMITVVLLIYQLDDDVEVEHIVDELLELDLREVADKVDTDDEVEDDELLEYEIIIPTLVVDEIDDLDYVDMEDDEDEHLVVIQVFIEFEGTDEVMDDTVEVEIQIFTKIDLMLQIMVDEVEVEYVLVVFVDEMVVNE